MEITKRPRRPTPTGTLKPIRPNAGIEAEYRRRLERAVDEMHRSLVYWVRASYPEDLPGLRNADGIVEWAADLSRAASTRIAVKRLSRRWTRNFDKIAPKLAGQFAQAAADHSDAALKATLGDAGIRVRLVLTADARDVVQANITENVALIKSIAARHLGDVEALVARSVAQGRDLAWLMDELEARYDVTRKRAALIARSQNNLATAAIQRVRFTEIGITEAVWVHSHGGAHARPSHVAFDGERYSVREGALIDGKRIWPGTEINCRCVSRPVLPGLRAD